MPRGSKPEAGKNKLPANIPPEKRSPGRPKGAPNKTTALLKDALLIAADQAGGKKGLVGYLKAQAEQNPGPFLALLGKVLPLQVEGGGVGGAINIQIITGVPRASDVLRVGN